MKLFITAIAPLFATLASAAVLPKREATVWRSPFSGTIDAPVANDVIVPGVDFAFEYALSNWCESAYTPFTVYLTGGPAPPPFENVNANGTLAEGSFMLDLGKYSVSNFGLPSQGTPPPSTLNLPVEVVSAVTNDTQLYLTVLQEFDGCPGGISVEYSLTSIPVTLRTTAV
ncbi:hypothetical protein BD311DRAFT_172396 [Dichomitus squalens]|uniref:Uncharacterized protein n=1 Tax=Dichomitus squalens TaxID=114155 RepID=A0A4Q9MVW0_9APHY|nr:hypothetical protein BD311DRAFT_172396 [Dichomitus squalens]